jgi:hypothetical protein
MKRCLALALVAFIAASLVAFLVWGQGVATPEVRAVVSSSLVVVIATCLALSGQRRTGT